MEINISGLKCDHCDYRDDSITFDKYKESIGLPCPKCEHSLLTQEEYDGCLKMYNNVEKLNSIGDILKWLNPFHYWRLLFGDNRTYLTADFKFKNRNNIN